jgi:hypothetical protein
MQTAFENSAITRLALDKIRRLFSNRQEMAGFAHSCLHSGSCVQTEGDT